MYPSVGRRRRWKAYIDNQPSIISLVVFANVFHTKWQQLSHDKLGNTDMIELSKVRWEPETENTSCRGSQIRQSRKELSPFVTDSVVSDTAHRV